MAYEKLVAAGTEPSLISFYYPTEDIFNDLSLRSMYQARNKRNEAGVDFVDDLSITEDERDIFNGLVKDAVYDVFLRFIKYTKDIVNAIQSNKNYIGLKTVAEINAFVASDLVIGHTFKMTDAGTITLGTLAVIIDDIVYYDGSVWLKDNARSQLCSFVQVKNNENYNQNYLEAVDENLFKGIRFYVLRDWANILSLDADALKYEKLYIIAINNIDKYGFQLKKVLN